ncbi:hypothetical protein EDC04DRAFT_2723169 [Pisolithus marmoratus]|nr:hypothetical protein EDC04DRAFT_2723169 [Pisolithus marmoratus]
MLCITFLSHCTCADAETVPCLLMCCAVREASSNWCFDALAPLQIRGCMCSLNNPPNLSQASYFSSLPNVTHSGNPCSASEWISYQKAQKIFPVTSSSSVAPRSAWSTLIYLLHHGLCTSPPIIINMVTRRSTHS